MGAQTSSTAGGNSGAAPATTPLQAASGLCFDELADSEQAVTAAAFEHLFSGPVPGFGSRLFKSLFGKEKPRVSKQEFIAAIDQLLRCDSRQFETVGAYIRVFAGDDGSVSLNQALGCACQLAVTLSGEDGESGTTLSGSQCLTAVCEALNNSSGGVTQLTDWVVDNMPGLFDSVHCWVERAVWSVSPPTPDSFPFALPQCVSSSQKSVSSDLLTDDAVWVLSTFLPPCYLGHHKSKTTVGSAAAAAPVSSTGASAGGQWNVLYNSRDQGLSLNRFKHHVLDYRGPSICCIRCSQGETFVLAVDCEWRESSSTWGGPECVAVQLRPAMIPLATGAKMILFNEKTRGVRLGLSIGRDMSRPSIHLDENLDKLTVCPSLAGAAEVLAVRHIEVWGCGGADLQEAQRKQKDWDKKQVEQRRKVKRPGRWEENADALLLEWGGVHTTSNFQADRDKDKDK